MQQDIDRVLNLFEVVTNVGDVSGPASSGSNSNKSLRSATAGTSSGTNKPLIQRRIIATASQLRYIKSLLGASSRLGRALAELFGLLVKLCVGNRIRLRHPQNVTTNYMSSASRDIARVLSYILVDGLSHDQLPPSPIPKLKQTFLICSIGFTSPMLFDEKRFAYHLMLHKFCEEGGLQAFFEMFGFALSFDSDGKSGNNQLPATIELDETNILGNLMDIDTSPNVKKTETEDNQNVTEHQEQTTAEQQQTESTSTTSVPKFTAETLIIPKESTIANDEHGEFPAGSGEFLDAWLMLLEKMVNPKAILESPHVITSKSLRNKPEFDTVSYLINVHILAFQTVTKIWSFKPIRTYGARMTESMLTIMKHIYQGETILREKYNKKIAEQSTSSNTEKLALFKFGSVFSRTGSQETEPPTNRLSSSGNRSTALNNSSAPINETHLNQLIAMGFLEEHCREALYHTGSLEQATEYLLTNTGGTSGISNALNENQNVTAAADSDDDENIDAEMMVLMGTKLPSVNTTAANDNKTESSGR